jgi:hypothetical protein
MAKFLIFSLTLCLFLVSINSTFLSNNNNKVPNHLFREPIQKVPNKNVLSKVPKMGKQEEELRKYASHHVSRKSSSNLRHDDSVVSHLHFVWHSEVMKFHWIAKHSWLV